MRHSKRKDLAEWVGMVQGTAVFNGAHVPPKTIRDTETRTRHRAAGSPLGIDIT